MGGADLLLRRIRAGISNSFPPLRVLFATAGALGGAPSRARPGGGIEAGRRPLLPAAPAATARAPEGFSARPDSRGSPAPGRQRRHPLALPPANRRQLRLRELGQLAGNESRNRRRAGPGAE